jgi:hypothetical protein
LKEASESRRIEGLAQQEEKELEGFHMTNRTYCGSVDNRRMSAIWRRTDVTNRRRIEGFDNEWKRIAGLQDCNANLKDM